MLTSIFGLNCLGLLAIVPTKSIIFYDFCNIFCLYCLELLAIILTIIITFEGIL